MQEILTLLVDTQRRKLALLLLFLSAAPLTAQLSFPADTLFAGMRDTLGADDFQRGNLIDPGALLQGKFAGVLVYGADTDWLDELFRPSFSQAHSRAMPGAGTVLITASQPMSRIASGTQTPPPLPKQRYRLTNWSDSNRALPNRGSITVYFSDEVVQSWYTTPATTAPRSRQLR